MRSMIWGWAYAANTGTASIEFNVPAGYYVIGEGALTSTAHHTLDGVAKVGIIGYTPPTGPPVNFGDWPQWPTFINGSGILNVTFGAFASNAHEALAVLNVFLW